MYNELDYKTERTILSMKKVIAVILSILCVLTCFAPAVCAIEDPGLIGMLEPEEPMIFTLVYKNQTLSGVKMMYQPNPNLSFGGPGYVTVTKDKPIAIDHDFVCWKDEDGKLYYAGDKFYVDGECELYAVWEEKKDNNIKPVRVFICAMLTMKRMFDKIFGVFKDYREFTEDRLEEMRRATTAFNTAVNAAKAQQDIVIKKESEGRLACTVSEIAVPNEEVDAVLDKYEFLNTETFTVSGGTTADGKTATDLIRPFGKDAELPVNGILNAATITDTEDGGKKVVLTFYKETAVLDPNGMTFPEKQSEYIDPLNLLTEENKDRHLVSSAELEYASTKIYATIGADGKLLKMDVVAPVEASAKVIVRNIYVNTRFEAVLRDRYVFTY